MCDHDTQKDAEAFLKEQGKMSRRAFTSAASLAGLSAAFAGCSGGTEATGADISKVSSNLIRSDVSVPTPDGTADCYFVHPKEGTHAGAIIWPDVKGIRPAFKMMGERLAMAGYAVLVINPYYREKAAPVFPLDVDVRDKATREKMFSYARKTNAETNAIDTKAFVEFLDAQDVVDTSRKIGTSGYCFGGPITMNAASSYPERIGAGASFHGGRLVTDKPDSPHLKIGQMQAEFLFAIAQNDDDKDPEVKNVLREAYAAAGLKAEIEVYEGALHGWCPPDSPVYNEAAAEKAWSRLLALYERALA